MAAMVQLRDPADGGKFGPLNQWLIEANQELSGLQRQSTGLAELINKLTERVARLEKQMKEALAP